MTTSPLLMIPGPTPVAPDVLAALAEPVRSHTGPENAATMLRIQAGIRELVGAVEARVYCFAGAGTLAMEVALVNHAAPGDRVVVVSHGYFGDRFTEVAGALGMRADVLQVDWGEHAGADAVRELVLGGDQPAVVCITHVDTSSGVLADCAMLAATVRAAAPDTIIVVDGVCATGGIDESMDAWDIDVLLTGAQKALSVPPGLALLAVSERARQRRGSLGDVRAYYADLRRWDASVDDPRRYFSTHAVSLLRALEVSLDGIFEEGLPSRYERHRRVADMIRDGMGEIGFAPLTLRAHLAPTLSVLGLPDGVDVATLLAGMGERGVLIAPCLGPWAGRGVRIGHMGTVTESEAARTIDAAAAVVGLHA
ncbi:MAG TPA: alanine--glyoxylate aminotransferase family protein [Candidatus Saccharimonadales bacterium]|nr:alanine--glyoxylate aminotransferase family protein [Candidatus Saccharimonadales bacterium]